MERTEEKISIQEAAHEVELVCRRLALLHLAFARTLVDELGEKEGKRLVLKAIKAYGRLSGQEVRRAVIGQGLSTDPENYGKGESRDLPRFGMNQKIEELEVAGEKRKRVYGCVLAKVWQEYGEEGLGRLYCYVDPAKSMAFNPGYKLVHTRALPDGDDFCELCIRPTTEREQREFEEGDTDLKSIDDPG